MTYPKISIVTPNFNQAAYLEQTIQSIVSQEYPNLEYIIIDGGSTDGSIEIIKRYEPYLKYWVSESDNGLYHALQKGFAQSTGEVMGWLNSDDLLHRKSLFVVGNIFDNNPHIDWLQGCPTRYDETGMTVEVKSAIYSKYHFYTKKYYQGRFIQQESTFWTRALWDRSGGYISQNYKYAGDFELWMRFFKHAKVYTTEALIGGYRVRKTQMSRSFYNEYIDECNAIIDSQVLDNEEKDRIKKIRLYEDTLSKVRLLRPYIKGRINYLYGEESKVFFDFNDGKFK